MRSTTSVSTPARGSARLGRRGPSRPGDSRALQFENAAGDENTANQARLRIFRATLCPRRGLFKIADPNRLTRF